MLENPEVDPLLNVTGQLKKRIDDAANMNFGKDREQYKCRTINSTILCELINEDKTPGIIYTIQPDRSDPKTRFDRSDWWFHSVGIVKLGENQYAAFDQSNEDRFFEAGTLSELSGKLHDRFGSQWDLTFGENQQGVDQSLSVASRIDKVQQLLASDKIEKATIGLVTPDRTDSPTPIRATEDRNLDLPLGLKFLPLESALKHPKARAILTFKYA